MPAGPVAESESRFDSNLSTLSGEKDTETRDSWVRLGKVGTESDGFRAQDLDANTEFRHSRHPHTTQRYFMRTLFILRHLPPATSLQGKMIAPLTLPLLGRVVQGSDGQQSFLSRSKEN